MAGVTLANIPIFVVQLFFFGVQSGSTVLISQYWGKGDREAINRVIGVALWAVNLVSVAFALVLLLFPVPFLGLFGNEPEVVALAAEYGRLIGLSYVFNGMTLVYLAAWRSMERPRLGMYILAASMGINTFLNWVLIFGKLGAPALGVTGAALATLIARLAEFSIVLVHIVRTRAFRFDFRLFLRPGRQMARKFVACSGPVVCNETLWGLGTSIFPTIMGHMAGSTEILAAYTIAGNVEKLCLVFAIGISGTASILIGREIGAGRSHQVYEVGLALNTLAALAGGGLGALLLLFTHLAAPVWLFPLVFPPVPEGLRHRHHDDDRAGPSHAGAGFQPLYHRGGAPGRRRCTGGQPHRPGPPVRGSHSPGRSGGGGAAAGHPVGLSGHERGIPGEVFYWDVAAALRKVDP